MFHMIIFILLLLLITPSSGQRVWTAYVYPDVTKAKSMVCYQCESNHSELFPICETNTLKIATRAEKQDLLYFCPPFADKYCFKLIEGGGNSTKFTRGCVGEHDAKGNSLKAGCVHFGQPKSMLCLCDTVACNESNMSFSFLNILILFLIVSYHLIFN